MKYKSIKKPDKCPECGSGKIAEILYGLPVFSPGLEKKINEDKITLGGCCVSGNEPSWNCIDCGTTIFKMKIDLEGSAN
jgi:hypothetical protein